MVSKTCKKHGKTPKKNTQRLLKENGQKKWVGYVELSSTYMLCRKL